MKLMLKWISTLLASTIMLTMQAQTKQDNSLINAEVDSFIRKEMKEKSIPGLSLAVIYEGKIIYSKGYGFSNLEHSTPATENTIYHIGSITKTFAASAIMMLMEDDKLTLDDPVSKYIPELPAHWQPLTLKHLLSHTSGISSLPDSMPPCEFTFDPENYSLRDRLKEYACMPNSFLPGEKFFYSGLGYLLLGMTIESVSGKSFERFLTEHIFNPLEMKNTKMINYNLVIPNRATGYEWKNGQFFNRYLLNPELELSDGGLMSSVIDMAKWDSVLYTNKLLKTETLRLMFTPTKIKEGVSSYGLGFGLTPYQGHRRVGHLGRTPGFTSAFSRFIDDKLSVILLLNREIPNQGEIANKIAALYFDK